MPFPSLDPALLEALSARGYAEPTAVQAAVLQPEVLGRDLLVSAQTGSGKTVAYGLGAAPDLLEADRGDGRSRPPRMLVIAPTRELALQVGGELEWLYARLGFRIVTCVGGTDMRRERRALADGADVVVGTPGRLRDHLERDGLDATALRVVVLDEADEMLDLGFREDLEAILDETPPERRTLLFSATVPRGIAALAKRYQRNALRIEATAGGEPHGDIEYRAMLAAPLETERALVNVLRYFEARGTLVFCATREAVARLQGNLLERGFSAVALSGELGQAERTRALQSLRDGRARVCVATDVAARGIDLPDLGLVVHADLPRDPATLLHRSGRTGRAGRKGTCVLLVPHTRRRAAERLLRDAGVQAAWSAPPAAEEVLARDRERLEREAISLAAEDVSEDDLAVARTLLAERDPERIAAALVRALRAPLPAAEELSAGADGGDRRDRSERPEEGGGNGDYARFRINIGRAGNADPRWLLPFLCRRGHVTRKEIGRIRVFDRETEFEVTSSAAARFVAAIRRKPSGPDGRDGDDGEIRIEPVRDGGPRRNASARQRDRGPIPPKRPSRAPAPARDA
ncbi:DEAD/DEAH box helicase (plasmid) [Skermanella mucosa]|uniref:DEAD/DEAH box helicase n=1 Tax=Skermanella mucosa TaxID=1789672 RepID=UPI00192BA8AB|nr:DEAD/DEAH box helicase [Skermanella mucosa]UEM24184.1 DEAD/DEAH box helicase [Skermanella mucosa]